MACGYRSWSLNSWREDKVSETESGEKRQRKEGGTKGEAAQIRREDRPAVREEKHSLTHTCSQTDSCRFAPAAFKAVMTGQRVIRDSKWRGHYSCSPLPANNCNYSNSTLTTIDLSLSLPPFVRVCACVCVCGCGCMCVCMRERERGWQWSVSLWSTRVVHTCCWSMWRAETRT